LFDILGLDDPFVPYACEDENDLGELVDSGDLLGCVELRIGKQLAQ